MKIWDVITTANSNLMRNKGRTFLTILAIFIGSFTIIATSGIRTGVNNYIDAQLDSAGGEGYIEIMPEAMRDMAQSQMGFGGGDEPQEYDPKKNSAEMRAINKTDLAKIRKIKGVQSVKPARNVKAEYITSSETDKKFVISPQALPSDRINLDIAKGKDGKPDGRLVSINDPTPEIDLLPGYAKALGFKSDEDAVGKTVKLGVVESATMQVRTVEARVAGVLNKSVINMGRSWINTALEDKILDITYAKMPQSYRDQVYFATAEWDTKLGDKGLEDIKDGLKKLGYIGMTMEDEVGMVKSFFDAIILVFTIFGGIALLAASIGIINTLFMAVQERTREIGLMKAMGLGKGKIFLMFSIEAISLGFWGSAIGVAAAYLAEVIVNPIAADTFLSGLPGFELIKYDITTLALLILLVMLIAFLAGTLPARRASKKDPIEALRYE
ncbi:MAG: ABC transporter permease [Candidatus Nomurabacteria bacterium]|jgi:putative ABC transport system permease protein|nr:ABC transporter permease [Candidatus Nomurabacteria bacterium]